MTHDGASLLCSAKHCTALNSSELVHCTALYHIDAQCTAQHGKALPAHCTAVDYTALYCTALHYTAVNCIALHYTSINWTALYCSELHLTELH